jgi:hypothetical protein
MKPTIFLVIAVVGDDSRLAGGGQTPGSGAELYLSFPGDVADFLWQRLDTVVQLAIDPCLSSISPGSPSMSAR